MDANVDELMTEMKELKETLEEKTKEADEYLDKYCSLLISHEKLEKAKEMLETQVARLSSQQSKLNLRSSPSLNSVVPGPSPVPSATEKKLSSGQNKASGKRQRSGGIREDGGETTPSTPEKFSKKSRKAVKSGIHPAEDAEDAEPEPEGLPEVVKKGTHNSKRICVLLKVLIKIHIQKDRSIYFLGYCVTVLVDLQKQ